MTYKTLLDYTLSIQPVVIKCLQNLTYRQLNLTKPSVYSSLIIDPAHPARVTCRFSNCSKYISLETGPMILYEYLKDVPEKDLYLSYLFNVTESQKLIQWLIVRSSAAVCQQALDEFFPDIAFKRSSHPSPYLKDFVSLDFEGRRC